MEKGFFRPYVGPDYKQGLNGKRTLIVGASFYCDKYSCQYFDRCTSEELKDSSPYNELCPPYQETGEKLEDEPSNCIDYLPKTYRKFANAMAECLQLDPETFWQKVAFTNYVQFMLPCVNGYAPTRFDDLSPRDFDTFVEECETLQPDVVIIWGCVIRDPAMSRNPFIIDSGELARSEYYVTHMRLPKSGSTVALINCYHPCSPSWWGDLERFEKYLTNEFKNK